ncbi:hypothetical protein AB0M43_25105 [Longispora sp. NPDC051575]|uniref:hypothetical protein n=1 Tax=Longispora sp. NPDC051575 TaxID=3154943 RepID=UPI003430FBAD
MSAVAEYRALVGHVAGALERANAEARRAGQEHDAAARRVEDRLEAARAALVSRQEELARAQEDVERADSTAERVWRDVRSYVGRRMAKRMGEMPEVLVPPAGTDMEERLSSAKDLMARARRGEWSPDPMKYSGIVAVLIGAIVAASIFGLARLVLGFGDEETLLSNLLAQLAVFLSPFAGIPLVVWGMARFRGQRTGVGTVALTVLGGLVVSCSLTFLIR